MPLSAGTRLEQYTTKRPQEVLLVTAAINNQTDQFIIFKGYSSSLMQPTAFDLDIPVLPDATAIITIDRLEGPYHPNHPRYLEQGLTWEAFQPLLVEVGV